MDSIYIVGTADTKPQELAYLRRLIAPLHPAVLVDIGTRAPGTGVDVDARTVAAAHPEGADAVLGHDDRGPAVAAMGVAFTAFIAGRTDVAAVIGIGGSGGTSVVCSGLRALPLGLPKVMVSTLASGDVAPYVDVSDIVMIPSVTDMAGLNGLSRRILHNAAMAVVGMVRTPAPEEEEAKPALGLTMFGVTTPCVTAMAAALQDTFDPMVFHATGTGGRTMEKLADSGLLTGFADMTTTEIADLLVGGVLPATEDRLGSVARTGLPWVGSAGALDMVNFHAPGTVPERFAGRNFYHHNPSVTLMRTTADECRRIGAWIAQRLDACEGEVRFLIPERGVSALDVEGGPFFDPEADAALFDAIEAGTTRTDRRHVIRLPLHINDPAFADAAVRMLRDLVGNGQSRMS